MAGVGPVVEHPVRTEADVAALPALDPGQVSFVADAVRMLTASLEATPLIGFAGAPFTLASYLIEGGPSKNYIKTKAMMYGQPDVWHALCTRLADITLEFLRVQIAAGVSAVTSGVPHASAWSGTSGAASFSSVGNTNASAATR